MTTAARNAIREVHTDSKLTVLHLCCKNGWYDITCTLIKEFNCDPNVIDQNGKTPLVYACTFGHLDIVRYHIGRGCNTGMECGTDQWTLLHYACSHGHLDIVQYLISEVGCVSNNNNIHVLTPLQCACKHKHDAVVKYLIKHNTSYEQNIHDILQFACENGHLDILEMLPNELTKRALHAVTEVGNNGSTFLHSACQHGHTDIVKYLVETVGCNPRIENQKKHSPVYYACKNGHVDTIKFLLNLECKYPTEDIVEVLILGCKEGVLDLVRTASEKYGSIAIDKNYYDDLSPLEYACQGQHLDIVQHLIILNCQKQLNLSNEKMQQLMLLACKRGHTNLVKLLAESPYNCGLQIVDQDNHRPLYHACKYSHVDTAYYIVCQSNCTELSKKDKLMLLCLATKKGHVNLAKVLVERHYCQLDFSSPTTDQLSPLFIACRNEHVDIMLYLLQQKICRLNVKDKTEILIFASKYGHMNLIKVLVECHSPITNIANKDQLTPLHFACSYGYLSIAEYLINKGVCAPCVSNSEKQSPLHYVCLKPVANEDRTLEVIKFLVKLDVYNIS